MALPVDTNTTARQKIDEEITQLESRILSLKSTRNTLSNFARLHPEIIQEIFVRACHVFQYRFLATGRTALEISWVCRGWRDLAHRTSELWSYIDFEHPTWIRTALSRTHNRPLSFLFQFHRDSSSKRCKVVTSLCLETLPRIKLLDIMNDLSRSPKSFPCESTLWLSPAPLLVELTLVFISVPPNVFSGICPSLQNLWLYSCAFHWESLPVPPGLKTLAITAPTSRISVDGFVSKLSHAQSSLEELRTENVFIPSGDIPNHDLLHSSSPPLHLPRLRSFNISEDHAPPLTSLFNKISTPVLRRYSVLEVSGGEDQYETVTALVSSCKITELPIGEVDVILEEDVFKVMLKAKPPSDPRTCELVYLTFERFGQMPDLIPFLQHLQLPFSQITTLTLAGSYFERHGSHFLDYFNNHTAIETLNVHIFFIPTFTNLIRSQNKEFDRITIEDIERLETPIDEDLIEQCRNALVFPRLTSLKYHLLESEDEYQFHRSTFTDLREWLLWRRVMGLGIKKLCFEDIYIPPEEFLMALYEDVVVDFECLGEEMTEESGSIPVPKFKIIS